MLRLYKEYAHKLEYISFVIHVNFDHAVTEHYPVTLRALGVKTWRGSGTGRLHIHVVLSRAYRPQIAKG